MLTFNLIKQKFKCSKWLAPSTMDLVSEKYMWMGVSRGKIITAMCMIMHPIMSKQNAIMFSKGNILKAASKDRYANHMVPIADLFLERFDPKVH